MQIVEYLITRVKRVLNTYQFRVHDRGTYLRGSMHQNPDNNLGRNIEDFPYSVRNILPVYRLRQSCGGVVVLIVYFA